MEERKRKDKIERKQEKRKCEGRIGFKVIKIIPRVWKKEKKMKHGWMILWQNTIIERIMECK